MKINAKQFSRHPSVYDRQASKKLHNLLKTTKLRTVNRRTQFRM